MLKIDTNTFMELLGKNRKIRDQDKRIFHYAEDNSYYYLYIKSVDYWEYYTLISKQDIINFGNEYEAKEEDSLEHFKLNVLYDAIKLDKPILETIDINTNNNDEPIRVTSADLELSTIPETKKGLDYITDEDISTYHDFLYKIFDNWEKDVLKAIDENIADSVVNKSFGDFLKNIFNSINTSKFIDGLRRVISINFKQGITEAETSLNLDIGISVDFDKKVNYLTNRQLDGFLLEDGKKWAGIKGVSQELQRKIRDIVSEIGRASCRERV